MVADLNTPSGLLDCESELLHLSGAIQSFGAFLCFDHQTGLITHCSSNLTNLLTLAESPLGQSVFDFSWIEPAALKQLAEPDGSTMALANIGKQKGIDAVLIRSRDKVIIEFEENPVLGEPISLLQLQRTLLDVPDTEDDMKANQQALLQAFRQLTGFDRIMLYKFHDDWSGEVIAEITQRNIGSYLGLRFPASDIPEIARKLYMVNASRMIADVQARPVPIESVDGTVADLTHSELRSVSPVHLQYLKNMGVGAAFSVSVKMGGALWGLVACHQAKPHRLSAEQRRACVALTRSFSLGLTSYLASCRVQLIDSIERQIEKIFEALALHDDPLDGIESNSALLMQALSAQGFAMAVNDDVVVSGEGPDLKGIAVLDDWFLGESQNPLIHTDHLAEWMADMEGDKDLLKVVSGMLAVKARSPLSGWVRLYWFRPAETQEVLWAGKPVKPVIEAQGVARLSPRLSFEKWTQIKTGHSRPWTQENLMVAAKFRSTLIKWL